MISFGYTLISPGIYTLRPWICNGMNISCIYSIYEKFIYNLPKTSLEHTINLHITSLTFSKYFNMTFSCRQKRIATRQYFILWLSFLSLNAWVLCQSAWVANIYKDACHITNNKTVIKSICYTNPEITENQMMWNYLSIEINVFFFEYEYTLYLVFNILSSIHMILSRLI